MPPKLLAACIQTNSTADVATNLAQMEPTIRAAAAQGATLIVTPENSNIMIKGRERLLARTVSENEDQTVAFFARMAKETGAWILAGSMALKISAEKLTNRSFLFDSNGTIVARYDKIHMFDVTLSDTEFYRESESFQAGDKAVIAETPWGKIGMTICYDVRFPNLYHALAKAGASIITIPAAFTATTGRVHWHVLTRARAIETGCFVLAPAQCGTHDGGRQTYGHSLMIAPNGKILAEADEEPGFIMTELDLTLVNEERQKIPSLTHGRAFTGP